MLGAGESGWQQEAAHRFDRSVSGFLCIAAASDRDYYATCERALIVRAWMDGKPTFEIEQRYSSNAFSAIGHGDARGYADGCRFLLVAITRIAAIIHETAKDPEQASALNKRLEVGVPAEVLPLVHTAAILSSGKLLLLRRAGVIDFQTLSAKPLVDCRLIVGGRAETLIATAARIVQQQQLLAAAA